MQHHARNARVRTRDLGQHAHEVVVGLAVVDHQAFAQLGGEPGVPTQRLFLLCRVGAAVHLSHPVVVQAGLPHGHHARVGGELGQPGAHGRAGLGVGDLAGAGGVHGHGGIHALVGLGGGHHGLRLGQVIPHRHHRGDPGQRGAIRGGPDLLGGAVPAGVQVGVGVDEPGQRLGQDGDWAGLALTHGPGQPSCWIGAHSGPVSPSSGSTFANSGLGLASGVPGTISLRAQRACSAA